ncbi:hypothetical protein B2M20_06270 [Nitrobacter vulgaris]|uniref:Uncharacterized protein n=2 Tax=Nitrobacter vulgaris TaxID=29421 RepID=A0A1V4I142_NITVU|nr:hypothetical protein B2M20_06270 [Nitrobacter vulgaris]
MAQPGVVMRWHENMSLRNDARSKKTARQKGAPLNFRSYAGACVKTRFAVWSGHDAGCRTGDLP